MNIRFLATLAGVFGAGMLILSVSAAEPQATDTPADGGIFNQEDVIRSTDDTATQAGVQPQGRGPVHEAFAEATADRPQPGPVVTKQPPEAVEELPPAEKPDGDDVQWISGYWSYDQERSDFVWVTGIWRSIPPGRQWVPGHWTQVDGGSQWVAGLWAAADGGDVAVVPAPPDPEPETPPAAPSADSTYVPGNYVYEKETSHFTWQSGYYVTNRPGWVWVPSHYVWTPCGYIFVEGYWDYDLQNRGLLFAPVVIDAQYLAQADWVYTPTYVVHDVALLDALFVRRDCGCYFFGDYFDSGYAGLGYVSWADYRFGGLGYDPLFSYYRWSHRHDEHWEKDLRGLYAARSKGLAGRPPHNLAQQQTLAKNFLAGNRVNSATLHHSVMLGPVGKLDHKVVKLQTLDRAGQLKYRKTADQFRTVSRQREQAESKLVAQGFTAGRKSGAQTLQLNLQKPTGGLKLNAGKTPPPLPFKRIEGTKTNLGGRNDVKLGNGPGGQGGTKVNTNNTTNLSGTPGGSKVNGNAGTTAGNQGGVKTNGNGQNPLKLNTLPGNTTTNPNGVKTDVKTDTKVGNVTGTQGGKVTLPGGSNLPVKPAGGNTEVKTDRIDRTNRTPPTPGGNGNNGNNGGNAGNKQSGGANLKLQSLPGGPGGNNPGTKSERIERSDRIERTTGTSNFQSQGNGAGRVGSTNFESVTKVQSTPAPERVLSNGGSSFGGRTNDNSVQRTFTQSSQPVQTFTQRTQPVQTFSSSTPRFSSGSSGFSGSSGSSFRNSPGGSSGFSGGGRRR